MIQLKNSHGAIENVPTFFFSFFVPLFRGQIGYAAIMLVAALCTMGFSGFVFPFLINDHHAKNLIKAGYMPVSEIDRAYLVSRGFIAPSSEMHKHAA